MYFVFIFKSVFCMPEDLGWENMVGEEWAKNCLHPLVRAKLFNTNRWRGKLSKVQ